MYISVYPADSNDATFRYRALWPLQTLAENSRATFKIYQSPKLDNDAEIALFQRAISKEHLDLMNQYKEKSVRVVFDIDDDVPNIDETNPANMILGHSRESIAKQHQALISTPNIELVLPGYKPLLAMKTEQVVEMACGNFDRLIKMMKLADVVTVSTVSLKKSYSGYGVKNITILHNQEKLSEWHNVMKTPLLGRTVIGWGGGVSHYFTDIKPIKEAVSRVLKENPQVHLHILGVDEIKAMFDFKDRVFGVGHTDWETYKTNMAELDITLAPSFGNRKFYRGKSDIRCLQSWMCGNPVVASDLTYGESVVKSGGGILADNPLEWYEALTLLVKDADERRKIGECGKQYVMSERTYEGHFEEWERAYQV